MRFPVASAPFTDRITCIGTLAAEDRSTRPLDILIDVSKTAAHEMRGWELGNNRCAMTSSMHEAAIGARCV